MFITNFLDTYENSKRKNFINPSYSKHPKTVFFWKKKKKIGIHSIQGWTATMRNGVTRKAEKKRLQDTENLFRKNLQLKDVCLFWT